MKTAIPAKGLKIAGEFLKKFFLKELKHLLTGQEDESEDGSEQNKFHFLNIFSKAEQNDTQDDNSHPIKDLIKSIIPGEGLEIAGEFFKKLILKELKHSLTGQEDQNEDESEQNKFHFPNIFSNTEQNENQDDNTHPIKDLMKTVISTKGLKIGGYFLEKLILKELKHFLSGQDEESDDDSEQNKSNIFNIFSKGDKNETQDDTTHPIKDLVESLIPKEGLKTAGYFLEKFLLKELKHLLTGQEDKSENDSEQNKFNKFNIFSKGETNETQDDTTHPIKEFLKLIISKKGLKVAEYFFKKFILSHPIKELMELISAKKLKTVGDYLGKFILKELKHFLSGKRGDNVHAKQYDGEENIHLVELIEPTRASGNFYHGSADEIESSKAMRDIQELLDERFGPARDNWNSMGQTEENEYYQNDDNNHALLDLTKSPIVLSVLDNAFGWLFDNNNGNTKDAIIKKVVEVASKFLGNDDNNSESDSDNHDMRDSIIKKVVEMAFNFFSNEANSEPVGQPSAFETQPAGCTDCIDSSYDAIYGGAGVGYEAGEDSPYYVYN